MSTEERRKARATPVWFSRYFAHRGDNVRADVPKEKADLLHAIYEQIVVKGRTIVSIRLTPAAYAHGFALALPEKVALARPTGGGRAIATYEIPIEGRDEWLAAARRLA